MAVLILENQTTTGNGARVQLHGTKHSLQAIVEGSGAVSATVLIQACDDGVNFETWATIVLSGTSSDSEHAVLEAPYEFIRARVDAISGTGASVDVWLKSAMG